MKKIHTTFIVCALLVYFILQFFYGKSSKILYYEYFLIILLTIYSIYDLIRLKKEKKDLFKIKLLLYASTFVLAIVLFIFYMA